MAKTGLPAISRRAFLFGSAAGALTFLGATHTNSGLVSRVLQFEHTDSITKPQVKRLFLCQIS